MLTRRVAILALFTMACERVTPDPPIPATKDGRIVLPGVLRFQWGDQLIDIPTHEVWAALSTAHTYAQQKPEFWTGPWPPE